MTADSFELGIGDGHHHKKRTAAQVCDPKCKMVLFAIAVIIMSIALNSFYFEVRLQTAVKSLKNELVQRVKQMHEAFETQIAMDTNVGEFAEEYDVEIQMTKHLNLDLEREKRQAAAKNMSDFDTPQSDQHNNTSCHNGISSARIAVIYADRSALAQSINYGTSSPLRMRPYTQVYPTPVCHNGTYTNGNRDEWCRKPGRNQDIFLLPNTNSHYKYFKTASWMNTPESSEYYSIIGNDTNSVSSIQMIKVKQPGMYIITSSMRFTQLIAAQGEYVSMSYGVYINDRNLNHERKVSSCGHVHRGTAKDDSSKVYPCSTWQLVPLRANDNVYMKIEPYTWFEINPDTMFLALIKLNDDLLQLPNGPNGPDYRG